MYDHYIQQGWECPKCNRIYSPSQTMCLYCGADQKTNYEATTAVKKNISDLVEIISDTTEDYKK